MSCKRGTVVCSSMKSLSRESTQRQNECACSSPVSNFTRQNGGIFKIPIVCFRFAWISPNQNTKVAAFRKGSFELPPSHIFFNNKKYCGNRCEFGDGSGAFVTDSRSSHKSGEHAHSFCRCVPGVDTAAK